MMNPGSILKRNVIVILIMLFAGLMIVPIGSQAEPKGEPFVIGYVGMVASPGTRPCMDIQKMAVEEINAAGGIMGRPVKYIVMDNKGDTSLSVEAFRKLVVEDKAKFISVEGRSEICLAVQEESGMLFKEYPHILVFNGPLATELTARILEQAPKFDHCFRDYTPDPAQWGMLKYLFATTFTKGLKAKKVAFLWEDLAWTEGIRRGFPDMNLPSVSTLAQQCGMEVVYSKAVKPRGTMYLPILQEIAMKKADLIFYVSSWFTDTESFTKQWAESAAKDTAVFLYGGQSMTKVFWKVTGGKALGVSAIYSDLDDVPLTVKTVPLMKKAQARKIPMQIHVHVAYADIYHFKAAIENAGGTGNIKKLIKSMEDTETVYSLGKMKYETRKVKPFYHSHVRADVKDIYKYHPDYYYCVIAQFQKDGKIAYVSGSDYENEKYLNKWCNFKQYKTPAELRMSN